MYRTFSKPHVQISTGFNATLALTTDNKIFSWGFDDQGQLGIPGQFSSEIKVTDLYPHLIYDKPVYKEV